MNILFDWLLVNENPYQIVSKSLLNTTVLKPKFGNHLQKKVNLHSYYSIVKTGNNLVKRKYKQKLEFKHILELIKNKLLVFTQKKSLKCILLLVI